MALPTTAQQEAIDFESAVEQKMIDITATGRIDSPHYYQPLSLTVINLRDTPLKLKLNAGQIFNSKDPDLQDIIVTKDEMIVLEAGQSINTPLFGMCIQEFNGAPGDGDGYALGKKAEGNLATLVQRIQKEKSFGIAAQQAIWALTDGRSPEDIASVDLSETNNARDMVLDLVSSEEVTFQGETFRPEPENKLIKRQMDGNFKYRIANASTVTIGLFNEQNIVVRELFNEKDVAAGQHKFEYSIDEMIDPTKHYYVRLIIDGEIKINFEMKPRRS